MIKFIKITSAQYAALTSKNADYFYYLTDTNKFYLGTIELSNEDISEFITEVVPKDGSIVVSDKNKVGVKISTKADNNLQLITETGKEGLYVNVPAGTDYTVTMTESTPEGYAKAYTLSQCGSTIGTINIPKDMVVESGSVVKNPTGQPEGTYLVLVLANATHDKVYINVSDLIEYVTAGDDTTTIHVNIDQNHKVTANVINGSIGATQLNATVKASLALADSALQEDSITTGSANGTIAVNGDDVSVKGLGSAAYTASTAYDAAGAATTAKNEAIEAAEEYADDVAAAAQEAAEDYADSLAVNYATAAQGAKADTALQSSDIATGTANGSIKVKNVDVSVKGLDSAAFAKTTDFDAAGSATTAENNAKAYADSLADNYDAAGAADAVKGSSSDGASAITVYGARKYAESLISWENYSA